MSHLSTIISRVKRKVEIKDFGSLFEQAVINLMEYLEAWTDATPEEVKEAIELYDKYRSMIKGNQLSSHKDRLKQADKTREKLK